MCSKDGGDLARRAPAVPFALMTLSRMFAAALQRLVDKIDPQEGRYRMLFESSPLPMWVFDAETLRFLAANETAMRLYGYSRQEFLSMTVEDICRAEDREAFRQFLRRESGSVNRGVFRHVKRGGTRRGSPTDRKS